MLDLHAPLCTGRRCGQHDNRSLRTSAKAADTTRFYSWPYTEVVQIVIRISAKIERFVACETFHPSEKKITRNRRQLELSAKFVELPLISCNVKNSF